MYAIDLNEISDNFSKEHFLNVTANFKHSAKLDPSRVAPGFTINNITSLRVYRGDFTGKEHAGFHSKAFDFVAFKERDRLICAKQIKS